jgi:molybdopterin-binding protein
MNNLEGTISSIEVSEGLSLVTADLGGKLSLRAIIIETPDSAPYLRKGNKVKMMFKETEVVIGTGSQHNISLQNRMYGQITFIEEGRLLSRIGIKTDAGPIESVISTQSVQSLGLSVGATVCAMVKLNEMMLSQ